MPEENFLSTQKQESIELLECYLNNECFPKPIRLNKRQLNKYKKRGAVAAWAIQPPMLSRRLIVFVDNRYPFSLPKTAVDPPFALLKYPHIEEDGYLCVYEGGVPKYEGDIEGIARDVIADSITMLQRCLSGENQKDFEDEILSYWNLAESDGAALYYSLLDLNKAKEGRIVWVWERIKGINFVADNLNEGERWLYQRNDSKRKWKHIKGIFVWSDKVLLPKEYPETNLQVYQILQRQCGQNSLILFQELAKKTPEKIPVIIGFKTGRGNALVCIELNRPKVSSSYRMTSSQELVKGFREGKLAPCIAGNRYGNSKTVVQRSNVQRVDPSWILARDSDQRIVSLKNKIVTIVGCGAVGSEVARMLAQNGICTFNLIDPDIISWENLGRHSLGADSIVQGVDRKPEQLASALKSQFPHIVISSTCNKRWEEVLISEAKFFHSSDLIIMATGDWPAENAMNKYSLAQEEFPAILYGWAEAYAVAGHSFAVINGSNCFNCAFDDNTFKFKLSDFTNEQHSLPTCGGVFQPFRSIEVAPINAMIASHAIDILMNDPKKSQIRSWIGSESILKKNYGNRTNFANEKIQSLNGISEYFLMSIDFDKIPKCIACKK